MLKVTPIFLAILYALVMYKFSAWRTKAELDAKSSELADPELKKLTDRMAEALDLPRVRVHIYEIEPVNGLAAPDGRIFLTRGFYQKYRDGEVTAEEMASVIAHELGHVALGHSRRRMIDFSGQNALRTALAMVLGRFLPGLGVMIANALGARTLAVDVSPAALAMAGALGADATLDALSTDDVGQGVRDLTGGGADISIDALGVGATFANSLRSLRKLGRHVQVGMPVGAHETVPLPLLELIYARQLSIHGMRGLDASGFGDLLTMVEDGRLDPAALVTQRIGLSGVGDALRAMDGAQPPGITVIDDMEH